MEHATRRTLSPSAAAPERLHRPWPGSAQWLQWQGNATEPTRRVEVPLAMDGRVRHLDAPHHILPGENSHELKQGASK